MVKERSLIMNVIEKAKSIIAIYAIVAVALIVSTVAIPFPKYAASWTAFVFAIISLVGGCAITLFAFGKADTLKSRFYGCPVFRIGIIYTIVQMCVTLTIYVVDAIVVAPYWIGLILSILIICVFAIGVIAADATRNFVQEVETKTIAATRNLKRFTIDIADVVDICKDENVYAPLKKLAERFKYSDTVSTKETMKIEEQISREIDELRSIITTEGTEVLLAKIENVSNLLSSRNRLCEATKRY